MNPDLPFVSLWDSMASRHGQNRPAYGVENHLARIAVALPAQRLYTRSAWS